MKKSRITAALLAIGISASMVFQTPVFATEETAVAASSGITTNGISGWPQGPEITSESAVIMEDTSDTLLYAKDMDTTLSPAGAVKIMTCLLALENTQLTDEVTMTATGVSGRYSCLRIADISSSIPTLKKMIMVALCFARSTSFSFGGIGVRPSIRVRITVWLTPGRVYSFFNTAAVARKELTPGITS